MKSTAAEGETGRFLIIGYGSPLRGDDALGQVAAAALAQRFHADDRVDVLAVHQLTLDLAERLGDYQQVILIDAGDGVPPGTLFDRQVLPGEQLPQPFSHYLAPEELLGIAGALYDAAPTTWLVGLGAARFDHGLALSSPVTAALPRLLQWVTDRVAAAFHSSAGVD